MGASRKVEENTVIVERKKYLCIIVVPFKCVWLTKCCGQQQKRGFG